MTALAEIIKQRIREHGAISIAEFMETALTHPEYGYYMQRDPFGKDGDFTTAPEISQVFGEIIGAWLAHSWQLLGAPKKVSLVELGAGRGTLMADIIRATKNVKGFHDAISINILEISPYLKQQQWKNLVGKHPRIEWQENLDFLPEIPLFIVANEFFDALPIKQFVAGKEQMITLDANDNLSFVISPQAEIKETCEPAIAITKQIANHIAKYNGAGLIIDYGYFDGVSGDTLQAMKNHAYCPVLSNIGEADLTAHVDFFALKNAANEAGAITHGAVAQGAFLMRLGAGERTTKLCQISASEQQKLLISGLNRLASPDAMGELFKVLAITSKQIEKAVGF